MELVGPRLPMTHLPWAVVRQVQAEEKIMDKKKTCVECSSSLTSAWADHKNEKKDTHVHIPSLEAVEDAKHWVEENQK